MNTQQIAAIYNKADSLAEQVTTFWCSAAGRTINKLEEFSLLVEWHDAIEAAQAAALNLRDWVGVTQFDAMHDECKMWLAHTAEA